MITEFITARKNKIKELEQRLSLLETKMNDLGTWYHYSNIIKNGDFVNEIGWNAGNGNISVNNNQLISNGNGKGASVEIQTRVSLAESIHKTVLITVTFESLNSNIYSFDAVLFGTGGAGYQIVDLKTGNIAVNRVYTVYKLVKISSLTAISFFNIRHNYESNIKAKNSAIKIGKVMVTEVDESFAGFSIDKIMNMFPFETESGTALVPNAAEGNRINVRSFGASGDGINDDSKAIQKALDSAYNSGGEILFPQGIYNITKDIYITNGNNTLKIIGYGASFSGNGKVILDSARNVVLEGLNAKKTVFCIRGMWWSSFLNINAKQIIIGDQTGTTFTDLYWNDFKNCGIGQLLLDKNRGHFNSNSFNNCAFRGDENHGFEVNHDYNIKILEAKNMLMQNSIFYACDLSYASINPLYIDPENTRTDNTIIFNECYFDTGSPDIEQNMIITLNECQIAGEYITNASLPKAAITQISTIEQQRLSGWYPTSAYNYFKDGCFMTGINQGGIISSTEAKKTFYTEGGMFGGYVNINQPLAKENYTWFKAEKIDTRGYYSSGFYIKNADIGKKTIRVQIGISHFNLEIDDKEWRFVTLCDNRIIETYEDIMMTIYTIDNTPYNVDISSVFVTLGRLPSLCPMPDFKTYIDSLIKK